MLSFSGACSFSHLHSISTAYDLIGSVPYDRQRARLRPCKTAVIDYVYFYLSLSHAYIRTNLVTINELLLEDNLLILGENVSGGHIV